MAYQTQILAATFSLLFAATTGCSGGGGSSTPSPNPSPPVSPPSPPPVSPPPPPSGVNTDSEADVTFATGSVDGGAGLVDLKLDIVQPTGECTENRPYVILIHGGGFTGGDKVDDNLQTIAADLAARGYPSLSINYRLAGTNPAPGVQYQPIADQLIEAAEAAGVNEDPRRLNAIASAFEDTVKAIDWAIANGAERCLDGDNFVMLGSSAGGITALGVAHTLDDYDITAPSPQMTVSIAGNLLFTGTMDTGETPIMVIHGTNDPTVLYTNAEATVNEAIANGLSHTFYTINGGGHGFGGVRLDTTTVNGKTLRETMYDFIEAHLEDNGTPLYETQTLTPAG